MARPAVARSTEELYEALAPLAEQDEALDFPLLRYCEAICSTFIEPVAELVEERDGYAPWEILLDPENCPAEHLEFLGQFVGAKLTDEDSEERRREKIILPEQPKRGQKNTLIAAVQATLTGAKTVLVDNRYGAAGAWGLRVRTLASETPDEDVTLAAVLSQKPIGIVLTYEAVVGQDWGDLVSKHATWTAAVAAYDTWADAVLDPP